MMDRRTLVLVLTVAFGLVGVMLIDAPVVPLPRDRVGGPRVFAMTAADVVGLEIALADGRVRLVRTEEGWLADDLPADHGLRAAIDALVMALTDLRVVDRFHDERDAPFGLEKPFGRVVVHARGGAGATLVLGGFNTARSAVYGRLAGDPDVQIIGVYLLSAMDRVFYYRHVERGGDAPVGQRPEIG